MSIVPFFADGTTVAFGIPASECETIVFQATLSYAGIPTCAFAQGALIIKTPDGVEHDTTPPGGIFDPLHPEGPVTQGSDPVSGTPVTYVVSPADVVAGQVVATASYNESPNFPKGVSFIQPGPPVVGIVSAHVDGGVDVVACPSPQICDPAAPNPPGRLGLCTTPPKPSCTMGAGISQAPPRPPKNAGLVKIAKGLTHTPAGKDTRFTVSGTLENCQNFPTIPGAAGPITAGTFKLSLEVPPGSTCEGLTSGSPVKGSVSITWNTPDPAKPGKFKKVGGERTTLASYTEPGVNPIIVGAVSQSFGPKSKTPGFMAKHAVLSFRMDQTAVQIATGCANPKKGLAILNFTGVNGPSTLEIQ